MYMKRFLLIALVLVSISISGVAETLWTGNISTGAWGTTDGTDCVNVPAAKFTMAKAGDKIVVTAKVEGTDPIVVFQTAEWKDIDGVTNQALIEGTPVEISLNSIAVGQLKSEGLRVRGNNIILTGIELVSNEVMQITTLWEGDYKPTWDPGEAKVEDTKLVALEEGDFIQITISDISGDDWPQLLLWPLKDKGEETIATIPLFDDKQAQMPLAKSVEVTSDNISEFKKGFYVAGCGCKISKIELLKSTNTGVIGITAQADKNVSVYNIQGKIVRKDVSSEEAFTGLTSGIYIVNGKKYLVR